MTNIINIPEGICFLSQLGEIVINETSNDSVRVEIYLDPVLDDGSITSEQPALYDELLYVDSSHNVSVCDLEELLQPYMTGRHVREFMVKVGSDIRVFAVVNSGEVEVDASPEEFLAQRYLTVHNGARRTSSGHKELLHLTEMRQLSLMHKDCYGGVLWTRDCGRENQPPVKAEVMISMPLPYDILVLISVTHKTGGPVPFESHTLPFVIKAGDIKVTAEIDEPNVWKAELFGADFATSIDFDSRTYIDTYGEEIEFRELSGHIENYDSVAHFRLFYIKDEEEVTDCYGYINIPEGGTQPKYEDVRAELLADLGLTKEQYNMPSIDDIHPFVRAYYADGSYKEFPVSEEVQPLTVCASLVCRMSSLNVSPSQFEEDGKMLMRYVVMCGARMMEYIIDSEHDDDIDKAVLLFLNSFGVPEFLYVNGEIKGQPEYERSAGVINGVYRNYKIKEIRYWEANTGLLTEEEEEWVLDMLRSKEVYICRDNEPWREVAITESKSENSTDPYSKTAYTFKYRMSQKRQSVVAFRTTPLIFTKEFNSIYA